MGKKTQWESTEKKKERKLAVQIWQYRGCKCKCELFCTV